MATGYYAGAQNGIWTATGAWKSTLAGATNVTAPTTGNTAFFNNNALTAAGNVYLSGARTISQIITNTNALNGITIRGGTLAVPATQTLTIASGTVQGAGSGSLTFHSTCTVLIPNNSALDTQSGTSLIFDGIIQGQNISQTGSGTVTFNNASFLPSYTVIGGTCNINNAAALGNPSVGSSFETRTGSTVFLNVALGNNYSGATHSFRFAGGTVVINNAGFQNVRSAFTALTSSILRATLSGSLGGDELNLGSTASLTASAASGITLTINSGITGNGTGSLSFGRAADTGVVTLAGASSTGLNVTTFVNFGTVVCSTATPLGAASSTSGISVAAGASLQLNAAVTYASRTVAISGTGSANAPNNGALIIGNTGTNTFSGITLGATAYIRATSSGTLTGGILTDSATGKNLTAGAASGVTLTLSSAITGSGTLTVGNHSGDTGTLTLSGANTFTGTVSVSTGTLNANSTTALGANTEGRELTVANAASLHINNVAVTYSNLAINIAGDGVSTLGAIYTTGSNVLNLGEIMLSADAKIRFGGAGSFAGTITNAGFALTLQAATGFFPSVISTITGAGALFVGGTANGVNQTGSVTLTSTSNNYTGTTTVSTGTLQVQGRLGLGTYAGNISIASSTTFNYNSSSNQTLSGTISGAGALQRGVSGGGVLTITGTNTYTGTTSISFSTISVPVLTTAATPQPLGTNATINVGLTNLAGTLRYTGTGDTTDKVINLAGTTGGAVISHIGSGTLTFTSNLTASGSGAKTLSFTGTVAPIVISGVIPDSAGGATALTYNSTSTLTLSAANTYTGLTTVSGSATVVAGNTQALGLGNVTLSANTATLQTLTAGFAGQNGKLTVAALTNAAGGTIKIGG